LGKLLDSKRLETQPQEKKIVTLKISIGDETLKYFDNLPVPEQQKTTAAGILIALGENLVPQISTMYERVIFNTVMQEKGETADKYANRLRKFIKNCRYVDMADESLRDRLIISIRVKNLRMRFYSKRDMTLNEVIKVMYTM
jgi:hypothetical protein